jgi:hypothetical protein
MAVLSGLPAFAIGPAGDDWFYARPLFAFPWEHLVPQGLFWRPLDHLVYWLTGFAPGWSVAACHLAAVLGHAVSLVALYRLLRQVGALDFVALVVVALVAVHPGNAAAVWSVDSNHQTWSTACGLYACLLALRGYRYLWLVPAVLAALWKESGLSWFAAAPMLRLMIASEGEIPGLLAALRREGTWLTLGSAGAVAYLSARGLLSSQASLGASAGRYAFSPNPLVWIRNAVSLLGVALLPVDAVAALGFRHNLVRGLTPALAALPLACVALIEVKRKMRLRPMSVLWGGLVLLAVLAPHIFIFHVSEMYVHPLTFSAAVVGFYLAGESIAAWPRQTTLLLVALVAGAFLFVDYAKYREMLATGEQGHTFALRNRELLAGARDRGVCFVSDGGNVDERHAGYSVFQMDVRSASGWGKALVLDWGWDRYDAISTVQSEKDCPSAGELHVIIAADGTLRSLSPP